MWIIVFLMLPNSTDVNVETLWDLIKAGYRDRNIRNRYSVIKLSMFASGPGEYPQLRGNAGEVRDLTPIIADIWRDNHDASSEVHRTIMAALDVSQELDDLISTHGAAFVFPGDTAEQLVAKTLLYAQTAIVTLQFGRP